MKKLVTVLIIIHIFVGTGSLAGGYLGMSDPTLASMGANSDEMLRYAPFDNFFIPGMFLFVVIGLMNIVAGVSGIRKWKYQSYYSGMMGVILVFWIAVQCYMLQQINVLHIIFFTISLIQAFLALLLMLHHNLFLSTYIKTILPAKLTKQ